jgi:hypothetical protein
MTIIIITGNGLVVKDAGLLLPGTIFGAIWGRECVLTFKGRGEEEKLRSEY